MTLTGDFITKNSVKVSYVHDIFGYRKGVVIKVGKGKEAKYGWSLVHKLDGEAKFGVKYTQLPIFQENRFHDKVEVLEKLLLQNSWVHIPNFDKEQGKVIAINRALQQPIVAENTHFPVLVGEDMPYDRDLLGILMDMVEHNKKYM